MLIHRLQGEESHVVPALVRGTLSPTIGFAHWHVALQSIFPYKGPGGRIALVGEVWFLGLLWAWVANNTGIILWTVEDDEGRLSWFQRLSWKAEVKMPSFFGFF